MSISIRIDNNLGENGFKQNGEPLLDSGYFEGLRCLFGILDPWWGLVVKHYWCVINAET